MHQSATNQAESPAAAFIARWTHSESAERAGELAKSFKTAKVDRVAELLATLASLGQARPAGDGRYAG